MRDLSNVINKILEIVPQDEERLVDGLKAIEQSYLYAAPEIKNNWWLRCANFLQEIIGKPEKHWEIELVNIFTGTNLENINNIDDKKLSKLMSYILRHNALKEGLSVLSGGYVKTFDLLECLQKRIKDCTINDIKRIVQEDKKQRYSFFCSNFSAIRANQGHSFSVDLQLEAKEPPEMLYHGTSRKNLKSILNDGLNKGNRHHVHLSKDIKTAKEVARRRKDEYVILVISSSDMYKAGIEFFESENGVWLVDYVRSMYINTLDNINHY